MDILPVTGLHVDAQLFNQFTEGLFLSVTFQEMKSCTDFHFSPVPPRTVSPMSDGKRNFIAESFLRHTYMKIWIGAKNIHRALFKKNLFPEG